MAHHPKEMWRFDDATRKILIAYDELRYHLLPYIYSVSWRVTSDGYTMMRPLVMDFQTDTNVFNIKDEYLFGPAIMACPVTTGRCDDPHRLSAGGNANGMISGLAKLTPAARRLTRPRRLKPCRCSCAPARFFLTGRRFNMRRKATTRWNCGCIAARMGSSRSTKTKATTTITRTESYATIPIAWNEATQTLTIGARQGSFPGMLKERTFRVVWVSENHGAGIASTDKADTEIHYNGSAVNVKAE